MSWGTGGSWRFLPLFQFVQYHSFHPSPLPLIVCYQVACDCQPNCYRLSLAERLPITMSNEVRTRNSAVCPSIHQGCDFRNLGATPGTYPSNDSPHSLHPCKKYLVHNQKNGRKVPNPNGNIEKKMDKWERLRTNARPARCADIGSVCVYPAIPIFVIHT